MLFFIGGHLEDGARDPRGAEHGGERGGRGGRDPQLLRQQLPRPLQPPGGRGGRGPGAQDARGGGVLGQVRGGAEVMASNHLLMPLQIHLRHAGHTQGAGAENIKIPRAGGLYPVPLVFRRQRRAVRADLRARGRHPLGRAQPRLHHRRHPAVQEQEVPLPAQGHGGPRADAGGEPGLPQPPHRHRRRLLHGRQRLPAA